MALSKKEREFRAAVRKAAKEIIAARARKIAPKGGVARWKDVPLEERQRLNRLAGQKGGLTKAANRRAKELAAAKRRRARRKRQAG